MAKAGVQVGHRQYFIANEVAYTSILKAGRF